MRSVFLFVLCISQWVAWGPAWGQPKKETAPPYKPASGKATTPQYLQRGTQDAPFVVQIASSPQGQTTATNAETETTHKDFYDKLGAWCAAAVALFTLALVMVGCCGVCAAVRTLRAIEHQGVLMKRQADLMEQQATLMQAQFDQYIEVANWRAEEVMDVFKVRVDLVNRSGLPMRLTEGNIVVDNSEPFRVSGVSLSPNVPLVVPIKLNCKQSGSFDLWVDWRFTHDHRITKQEIVDSRGGKLTCSPTVDGKWETHFVQFAS